MADQPRVMVISHGHPDRSPGGGENAAYALFEGLSARPDVAALFVSREPPGERGEPALGVGSADGSEVVLRSETEPFRLSLLDPAVAYHDFARLLEWFRPDIVHFHHYFRLGVELLRTVRQHSPNVPIVLTLHEFLAMCRNDGQMIKTKGRGLCDRAEPGACHDCFPAITAEDFVLRERYIKSFFGLVDAFVVPSAFLARRYAAWGLPNERLHVIENGLRGTEGGAEVPPRTGLARRLGFFGQIIPTKGLHVLLEAMALLPLELRDGPDPITLDVNGSRLEEQPLQYQELVRERLAAVERNVRLNGRYTPAELPDLMRNVDWLVMPSVWWENSPLVIQEAFAYQTPVICAGIGGMAEKVTDGVNGLHFRVGDAQHLAEQGDRGGNHAGSACAPSQRHPGCDHRRADGRDAHEALRAALAPRRARPSDRR